jgi:hypothetical protein
VATVILGVLLMLSGILVTTTLLPAINVGLLVVGLAGVLLVVLLALGIGALHGRRGAVSKPQPPLNRETWRMPPLAMLDRPVWSRGRLVAMWALRGYLIVAVLLLVVRAVQIGAGH